ncbi:MAG: hypothetical protein ACRDH7_09545 [Actinomycetota bacterium]
MDTGTTYPPEGSGAPRRGFFARRPDPTASYPAHADPNTLEGAVEERLDAGLQAIQEQAAALMREIASEMWRASGTDIGPEQDRILSFLSRDQAIRSLIASSDDRFQVLAVRTARLEDALAELAENGRLIREAIQMSAQSIHEVANSPTLQGVELIRTQLEQVEVHISSTFQHLDERDHKLTGAIQERIVEHGDLIARETARIVEAMESYVQGGAEAMGRLASRIEQHAESFANHDDTLADKLRGAVKDQTREIAEQVQMLGERVGIQGRSSQEHQVAMERLVETRVMGLAQLSRSDSLALRELIDRNAAAQEDRLRDTIDDRMSAMTLAFSGAVERNMAQLSERVDAQLAAVAEVVTHRAAEAADGTPASTFDKTLERLDASIASIDAMGMTVVETLVSSRAQTEERIGEHVDDRLAALAKMIRSDNRVLAQRMSGVEAPGSSADAEAIKQTLRAVKELQAGLGADVVGSVERRFQTMSEQLHKETQSTTEAMVKVAEVLGEKVDRLSVRVDEGVGGDLQIVIDRMSDAIQAMSGRGRRE